MLFQSKLESIDELVSDPIAQSRLLRTALERVHSPLAVIFSGSAIEGNATPTSDVDLIAVVPSKSSNAERGQSYVLDDSNIVVDLEIFSEGEVANIFDRIDSACRHNTVKSAWAISKADIDIAHRLTSGVCLSTTNSYSDSLKHYRSIPLAHLLLNKQISYINSSQIDLIGSILVGDCVTQHHISRKIFDCVITLVNAAAGYTNPSEKWRYKTFTALEASRASEQGSFINALTKFLKTFAFDDMLSMRLISPTQTSSLLNAIVPLVQYFVEHGEGNITQKFGTASQTLEGLLQLTPTSLFRFENNLVTITDYKNGGSVEVGFEYFFALIQSDAKKRIESIRSNKNFTFPTAFEDKVFFSADYLKLLQSEE